MTTNQATSKQTRKWDAIVVGSGLGGLSAAAYLSAAGQRTLLLERYSVLGGSSHVFRRKKQWEFDCGVHYIGDCGPGGQVPTLLRGLGLDDRIEWLPLDEDGFDTIIGPDLELRIPTGWDHFLERLIAAFPGEERGLRYYVSVLRSIGENFDRSLSPATKSSFFRALAGSGSAGAWALMPHAALLAACRLKPSTILALGVEDGVVATTPMAAPVVMRAAFLQDAVGGGAWYPKGGGQMLAAGFAEVIRSHNGAIRTQAHVDRILIEGGEAKGVRLADGEEIHAPAVVAAGDIKRTYRDLVGYENLPRSVARECEKWKWSQPLINACFGIEIDIEKTPNSNFFSIPNWDNATSLLKLQQFNARVTTTNASKRDPLAWARDFARNQPAFVQCSTRHDPANHRTAPPGHAAIEAQTLTPSDPRIWGFDGYDVDKGRYRRSSQYQEIKEIVAEGLLERVEQAYPGASSKVRWAELGTPASQERFTHTSHGTAFGIEMRPTQFGPFRPDARTAIKGLFLAGTSTRWGPATEGAMLSGLHAASAVTGRDLQGEIRAGRVIADPTRLTGWGPDFDPYTATRMLGRKARKRRSKGSQDANDSPEADEQRNAAPLDLNT